MGNKKTNDESKAPEIKEMVAPAQSMSIYGRLQKSRVELQEMNIKKSGKNTYSNYEYFELGDFLPAANRILYNNGLMGRFMYGKDEAKLLIIDIENPDKVIAFTTPISNPNLKGAHDIQIIGATQTYARRYLYIMALEIAEHDAIDQGPPVEKPTKQYQKQAPANDANDEAAAAKEAETIAAQCINGAKIASIQASLNKIGMSEPAFCEFFKIPSLDKMPLIKYIDAMKALDRLVKEHEIKNNSEMPL